MTRALTPTLALIIAGGLAAGIGLARPSSAGNGGADPAGTTATESTGPPADDVGGERTGNGYRTGNRPTNRGGVPAEGADPADQPATDGGDSGTGAAGAVTVTIDDFAFTDPGTVAPGGTVTVTNVDGAPHTLTFRAGGADTGTLDTGESATVAAPTVAGTHDFFCTIHPSMEGRIVVSN